LVYGPLSDCLGRRRVLLAGLAITLGTLLAALTGHTATLIVARTLQGVGTAASMVVGRGLLQDLFEGAARDPCWTACTRARTTAAAMHLRRR